MTDVDGVTPPERSPSAHPLSALSRTREAYVSVGHFVTWVFAGSRLLRPSARFAPIGIGLALVTGLPTREHGLHPALHGAPRVLAVMIGVTIIAGYYRYSARNLSLERRRDEARRARRAALEDQGK